LQGQFLQEKDAAKYTYLLAALPWDYQAVVQSTLLGDPVFGVAKSIRNCQRCALDYFLKINNMRILWD
jgi:hypothetical protein